MTPVHPTSAANASEPHLPRTNHLKRYRRALRKSATARSRDGVGVHPSKQPPNLVPLGRSCYFDPMRSMLAVASLLWTLPLPAGAETLGERGLAATFYIHAPGSAVELLKQMRTDLMAAMQGPDNQRVAIERVLASTWTEPALKAEAAKQLEKTMGKTNLQKALKRFSPEVQSMLREGTAKPADRKQQEDWLWEAMKLPDGPARQAQVARIVPHLPDAVSFRNLAGTVIETLADCVEVSTGSDAKRAELRTTYWEGVEPAITELSKQEGLLEGGLIAYRKRSLAELKMLADALTSPEGAALQVAAAKAVFFGAESVRLEVKSKLKKEIAIAAANPPPAPAPALRR
jgi:hypothetical protein